MPNNSGSKELVHLLFCLWNRVDYSRKKQVGLILILMVITSIAEILSIGAVIPFLGILISPERIFNSASLVPLINWLSLTEPSQLYLPLTLGFCVAILISGASRLLLLWVTTRISFKLGAEISIEIYRRTLYQPFEIHTMRNSSEVISAISSKTNTVINSVINPLLNTFSSCIILIAILGVLLFIDPSIALMSIIGFSVIYLSIVGLVSKRLERNSSQIAIESIKVIRSLQEGLGGIRDILIDGSQYLYCKIYQKSDYSMRKAEAGNQFIAASPRYVIESMGMVLIALLAYSFTFKESGVGSVVPILGAFALGAQRMLPLIQTVYHSWSSIKGNQQSLYDVINLLEQPLPKLHSLSTPSLLNFEDCITLNQVSFRYGLEGSFALKNISLQIQKGARVGFIGTTGSGKSTLLDIFMALLEPSKGYLSVDGVMIDNKNYRAWQSRIAHVPQSIYLTDGSISENIAFGSQIEDIDFSRVKRAAEKAQLSQTIDSWEEGYSTQVGERGVRLSGGQRQRVGIARALYKDADVLIFDEATSALDDKTESLVMSAINELGPGLTVLIIAHRITTLSGCDTIIELTDGSISKIGSYSEIISNRL